MELDVWPEVRHERVQGVTSRNSWEEIFFSLLLLSTALSVQMLTQTGSFFKISHHYMFLNQHCFSMFLKLAESKSDDIDPKKDCLILVKFIFLSHSARQRDILKLWIWESPAASFEGEQEKGMWGGQITWTPNIFHSFDICATASLNWILTLLICD